MRVYGAVADVQLRAVAATNSQDVRSAIQLPFPETLNRIQISFGAPMRDSWLRSYKRLQQEQPSSTTWYQIEGKHHAEVGFSLRHYLSLRIPGQQPPHLRLPGNARHGRNEFSAGVALVSWDQSDELSQNSIDIREPNSPEFCLNSWAG